MKPEQLSDGSVVEALQLKDHIASDENYEWAVYVDKQSPSGSSYRYDNYREANDKFNTIDGSHYVDLVLYTRLGTSVLFRHKEP